MFSRFLYWEFSKGKDAVAVLAALKRIFNKSGVNYSRICPSDALWLDLQLFQHLPHFILANRGGEWVNAAMNAYLKTHHINLYHTRTPRKALQVLNSISDWRLLISDDTLRSSAWLRLFARLCRVCEMQIPGKPSGSCGPTLPEITTIGENETTSFPSKPLLCASVRLMSRRLVIAVGQPESRGSYDAMGRHMTPAAYTTKQ